MSDRYQAYDEFHKERQSRPNGRAGAKEDASAPSFRRIINPAEWEGKPIPERKWCVPGCIPHAAVTLLSGDGGQGKSLLSLQLAVARSLYRKWIGLATEPGRTLVLSAEDDADEMHRRLQDIRAAYGASWGQLCDMRLVDLVGEDSVLAELVRGGIEPTKMYRALDAYMKQFAPSLLTLDVLADMFSGEESNRAHVRQFVNLLKRLAREHDCAILLLAHPSQSGITNGTGLSGSTDWNNAVRARLYFYRPKGESEDTPDNNLRVLEGMKSNYGARGGKVNLKWERGVFVPLDMREPEDKRSCDERADNVFLSLVEKFQREGRDVSPNPSASYAPSVFADEQEAACLGHKRDARKKILKAAFSRSLSSGRVKIEAFGPPSHLRKRIVLAEESANV